SGVDEDFSDYKPCSFARITRSCKNISISQTNELSTANLADASFESYRIVARSPRASAVSSIGSAPPPLARGRFLLDGESIVAELKRRRQNPDSQLDVPERRYGPRSGSSSHSHWKVTCSSAVARTPLFSSSCRRFSWRATDGISETVC